MDDRLTAKQIVIGLMRQVFVRLHKHNIYVADVINALRRNGVEITRTRFDDLFMTRPEREVNISVRLFTTVIEVLFEYDTQIISAEDFFKLVIAMRIPLQPISSFAHYFSAVLWKKELQRYGFQELQLPVITQIIGREDIIEQLQSALLLRTNLALIGPAGIGKTTMAFEMMRRYETYTDQKTFYLDVKGIHTLAQLYVRLATVFNIKPLANEPILLRLQMVFRKEQPYLIIDNLGEEGTLTPEILLYQLDTYLPQLRVIVTTRQEDFRYKFSNFQVVDVPALTYESIMDSACILFLRIFYHAGGAYVDSGFVLSSCHAVAGNPLYIGMIANAVARGTHSVHISDFVQQALEGLSQDELKVLQFLSICAMPMTQRVLEYLAVDVFTLTKFELHNILYLLINRQVIYLIPGAELQYEVHAVLRQVILHKFSEDTWHGLVQDIGKALTVTTNNAEGFSANQNGAYTSSDLTNIVVLSKLLIERNSIVDAAKVVICWHELWTIYGLSIEATSVVESCVMAIGDIHPLYAELCYVLGLLYSARGLIRMSITNLERALVLARDAQLDFLEARCMSHIATNTLNDKRSISPQNFAEFCENMEYVIAYFTQKQNSFWLARTYNTYSFIYFNMGNIADSFRYNNAALALFQPNSDSFGLLEVLSNRGLILLAMGQFDLACQQLIIAKDGFLRSNIVTASALCSLRLSVVAVINNQVTMAFTEFRNAFMVLYEGGGIQNLLFMIDLYCSLMLIRGQKSDAVGLYTLCNLFREERAIYRAPMYYHLFDQQIQMIDKINDGLLPQSQRFPPEANFYDVIHSIRHEVMVG
jgi:tetratricopeptide (TPR) repeat protein